MKLNSKLDLLLTLDLDELIAVQKDVTFLIELKIHELPSYSNKGTTNYNKENEVTPFIDMSIYDKENTGTSQVVVQGSDQSDDEDYILTQFDHSLGGGLQRRGTNGINIVEQMPRTDAKSTDLSSPLKESQQSISKMENTSGNGMKNLNSDLIEISNPPKGYNGPLSTLDNNRLRDSSNKSLFDQKKKKIRFNPSKKQVIEKVNFNTHPLSKRPWILEDFKRNEDLDSFKRGRKRINAAKLHRFYSKGGLPPNIEEQYFENFKDQQPNIYEENIDCEFENLQERSKSPPGFGRLDFPTTQERYDDKQKAQEIIFQKTKHRFIDATQSSVPPQERKYLFKNDYLNGLVDNGEFQWADEKLEIFMRK